MYKIIIIVMNEIILKNYKLIIILQTFWATHFSRSTNSTTASDSISSYNSSIVFPSATTLLQVDKWSDIL